MAEHDESPTRRSVLSQAAAGAAVIASGAASAQPAPAAREKGPLVWMNMDQKELDDSYDQAVYAPNRDIVIKRCVRNSELARERLGAPKRFSYGPTSFEGLDVFTAKTPNAPIMIYHPRRLLARRHRVAVPLPRPRRSSMPARNIVVPDFANVGDVGGSLLVDGRSDPPLGGLGLQERQELRRRSRAHLRVRPIVRRPSGSAC